MGFEDAKGGRFTFPFHNGRLFSVDTPITLKEFDNKRINQGENTFYDRLPPVNFLNYYEDYINRVNLGVVQFGGSEYSTETEIIGITSAEVTNDLTNFLSCETCTLENLPGTLETFANQIPEKYDPGIPYLFIYNVGY